jgi:hypothetical protein
MGKQDTKVEAPAKTKAPKKERKIRTIEEQIADAEARAKALREKAEARANKGRTVALEKRAKLVAKRDELTKQIEAIDAEYPPAETETPVDDSTDTES